MNINEKDENNAHYFKNNLNLESDEREFDYVFKFKKFKFVADIGVFSKNKVDGATDILLNNLPEFKKSDRILDLGCGYGVVGVILSKIYGCEIIMSDVNERALKLAQKNLSLNQASAKILKSDGFEKLSFDSNFNLNLKNKEEINFDYIILNPPIHAGKEIIFEIYEQAKNYFLQKFFIVIRKKHGAVSHLKKLREIFGYEKVFEIYNQKGICVFCCNE